jgi:hypothetical protein
MGKVAFPIHLGVEAHDLTNPHSLPNIEQGLLWIARLFLDLSSISLPHEPNAVPLLHAYGSCATSVSS